MPQSSPNRLSREKSPYLLQHAHNPVDWYPWGAEAFEKASREDKPILLSIGYSTCHWCHVMERESFESDEIAAAMNRYFVSIKVDREERPDLDSVYMDYVIAATGRGGWPTPDRKPFYGGTYFPPEDRHGMTGFKTLLASVADSWKNRKAEILNSAESAVVYLNQKDSREPGETLGAEIFEAALGQFEGRFDPEEGGFGSAPKFPMGHSLSLLLRIWKRAGSDEALSMARKTLAKMAAGGVYDQLGGGFHRYSTDRKWFLPHFEKMLYDQALLSRAYTEAYQATRDKAFAATARGVFDYVLREMTSPEGGFYSAQDADSLDPEDPGEKKEGAFFVWKMSEIQSLLDPRDLEGFCRAYGVEKEGNVAQDPFHEFTGKNVLFAAGDLQETEVLERCRKILFEARKKRPAVHLDDKVLTDWNGLMIASFACASHALEEPKYLAAAQRASDFIEKTLWSPQKGLLHRYRDHEAAIPGTLSDYAFYIYALLELYQADFDPKKLELAKVLTDRMIADFWDEKAGGFFMTAQSAEKLITRPKEDHDGAVPSGNSIAAMDLLILYRITGEARYEDYASKTLSFFSGALKSQSSGFSQMLAALDLALGPSVEITVTKAGPDEAAASAFLKEVHSHYLPNKVVKRAEAAGGTQKSSVSICRNFVCELPVTDVEALRKLLTKG
jgi:hypothetical protein